MKITRKDLEKFQDMWILYSETQSRNTAYQYMYEIKLGYVLGPDVKSRKHFNDETQLWEVWAKL